VYEWAGNTPASGQVMETEVLSLLMTDGTEGRISGEMAWVKMAAPVDQSSADRQALLESYLAAQRSGDVATLMSLYSDGEYFGCAVRPYFDRQAQPYQRLGTREELQSHLHGFYEAATVVDIEPTNWMIGDWFLFIEARWILRLADGETVAMMSVDLLPLGSDGKIVGRIGYGSAIEPRQA
jgi:hypothetical protein